MSVPLPDRPDLAQLRRRAKELHRAAAAGDPAALARLRAVSGRMTLSAAQRALAHEYGFASWPRLKAEVAQRAAVAAVKAGDAAGLVRLLRRCPQLAVGRSADGRTLLNHLADWPGHWPREREVARTLLAAGADINARAIDPRAGETPLQWAVSSDDVAMVDLLLAAGAPVDGLDADRRPLAQALFYGSRAAADLLVRRGAALDLELAAGLGRVDLLPTFFDDTGALRPAAGTHHPPVNTPIPPAEGGGSELREQALAYAVIGGQVAAADYLLGRGADINAQPAGFDVQCTPLHWAASRGDVGGRQRSPQFGAI